MIDGCFGSNLDYVKSNSQSKCICTVRLLALIHLTVSDHRYWRRKGETFRNLCHFSQFLLNVAESDLFFKGRFFTLYVHWNTASREP